jgi:segregation and condensation protein A
MPLQEPEYRINLENVFEGPMDLLIHLIRKNEVDVYDIPVALITRQYLKYLEWIQLLNIDNVGDFLLMAATLAQIKSRMLLPSHGEEDEDEDPRLALVRPLADYLKIKSAAEELARRPMLGDRIFTRHPNVKEYLEDDQELIQVGLFELIDAFQHILKRTGQGHTVDMAADQVSVKDRMNGIITVLEDKGSITFTELFEEVPEKYFLIATFLAVLELMKMNLIHVVQSAESGIIRLFYQ